MDFVAQNVKKEDEKKRSEPQFDRLFSGRRFSSETTFFSSQYCYYIVALRYIRTYYSKVYYFGGSWTIVRSDSRFLFFCLPIRSHRCTKETKHDQKPYYFRTTDRIRRKKKSVRKISIWKEKLRRLSEGKEEEHDGARANARARQLNDNGQWFCDERIWILSLLCSVWPSLGRCALIRTFEPVMRTSLQFNFGNFFFLFSLHYTEFSCHTRTRMIRLVISFSFNNKYFRSFCDSIREKKILTQGKKERNVWSKNMSKRNI